MTGEALGLVAHERFLRPRRPAIDPRNGVPRCSSLVQGLDEAGNPSGSLNHYSKGAVISFLHTHTAGIQAVEPGYRRFRVAPRPGGGLRWAAAVFDSPYGRIESSWRIDGDRFDVVVTVPPGTTAEVVLPDGRALDVSPGTSSHESTRA